ncbi:hypothetical protein ACLOJK_034049, partial [Asimina triloba]
FEEFREALVAEDFSSSSSFVPKIRWIAYSIKRVYMRPYTLPLKVFETDNSASLK